MSGTSFAWADTLDMQEKVATANGDDLAAAWLGDPATRTLLNGRERVATSGRFIWVRT